MRSSLSVPVAIAAAVLLVFVAVDSFSTGLLAGAITLIVALVIAAVLRLALDAVARRNRPES